MPPSPSAGELLRAEEAPSSSPSPSPVQGGRQAADCRARLLHSAQAAWHVRLPGNQVYCEPPLRALLKTPAALRTAAERRKAQGGDGGGADEDEASEDGDFDDEDFDGLLPWTALLASRSAMLYNGYPMPDAPKKTRSYTPEYWQLPAAASSEDDGWKRVAALDCEMVGTPRGDALARLAVVDEFGRLLYSTLVRGRGKSMSALEAGGSVGGVVWGEKRSARVGPRLRFFKPSFQVKPERPVIDYRTAYTGITPTLLENVTTTLQDVKVRHGGASRR